MLIGKYRVDIIVKGAPYRRSLEMLPQGREVESYDLSDDGLRETGKPKEDKSMPYESRQARRYEGCAGLQVLSAW